MSLTESNRKKNYSNKDNGNIKVAVLPTFNKKGLNKIRQIGNKAKDKFSINKLLGSKQKPAKIIPLKPNKDK